MKICYVYFLTNKNNTVIYTGVTSDLVSRLHQHKSKHNKGFSSRFNCDKLVYFERFSNMNEAITREKQIKSGNRKQKEKLIESFNPDWLDLSDDWS